MDTLNLLAGSVMLLSGFNFLITGIAEKKRNSNTFDQKNIERHLAVGFALFAVGGLVFLLSALGSF